MKTNQTPLTARSRPALRATTLAVSLAVAILALTTQTVQAQTRSSALYYQMGGSSAGGLSNYKSTIPIQIGLAADLRLNYSCGKFDIGLSWSTLMNNVANLGQTFSNAVRAGIASLPMYIFQRAQPGLYQLFQTYSAKADAIIEASLLTCEEMEKQIKAGGNPYEDWVNNAKGETWRAKASLQGDVVQAKTDINKNEEAQKNGVSWIFGGAKAGGVGTQPLRPIRDLSVAGYSVTMNRPTTSSATLGGTPGARLTNAFATPEALAEWTTKVLGDQQIYLCEGLANCPAATSTSTATGLGPRLDAELDIIRPKLSALVSGVGTKNAAALKEISAPGIAITPQLLQSLRSMPPDTQSLAGGRLAYELAMQRVIDKALVARNVLIAGLSLPEVTAAGKVSKDMEVKVARLNQYIEDLMFEHRIRKEITSNTALQIMDDATMRDAEAARLGKTQRGETAPVVDGRVKP
jgi:integrating conjugative element protein (TIGR03755 family)